MHECQVTDDIEMMMRKGHLKTIWDVLELGTLQLLNSEQQVIYQRLHIFEADCTLKITSHIHFTCKKIIGSTPRRGSRKISYTIID